MAHSGFGIGPRPSSCRGWQCLLLATGPARSNNPHFEQAAFARDWDTREVKASPGSIPSREPFPTSARKSARAQPVLLPFPISSHCFHGDAHKAFGPQWSAGLARGWLVWESEEGRGHFPPIWFRKVPEICSVLCMTEMNGAQPISS